MASAGNQVSGGYVVELPPMTHDVTGQPAASGGVITVSASANAAEAAAFDASNDVTTGSITNLPPTLWERTWLSPEVQHTMRNSATGMVVGAAMNLVGTAVVGLRSDGYNFATGQRLNPVQRRDARIDSFINLATLPIGMGSVGAAKLEMQSGRAVWVQSTEIRQSQQSISFAKKDVAGNVKYTLDDIARGLQDNPADPRLTIDAVRMRDGSLTSLDNSRPAVLNAQGGGEIRARIREFDEPLTAAEIDRFRAKRAGIEKAPTTWGEAAELRIWKQGDQFMNSYPNGAPVVPKITGAPSGTVWEQFSKFPWQR